MEPGRGSQHRNKTWRPASRDPRPTPPPLTNTRQQHTQGELIAPKIEISAFQPHKDTTFTVKSEQIQIYGAGRSQQLSRKTWDIRNAETTTITTKGGHAFSWHAATAEVQKTKVKSHTHSSISLFHVYALNHCWAFLFCAFSPLRCAVCCWGENSAFEA